MMTQKSIRTFCETGRVLIHADDFIYLLPHPALRRWISNYTVTFPCAGMMSDGYSVLPHGCATFVCAFDESGVYDMAHFVRDFKSICGITPREYREHLSDFYSEIANFDVK